MTTTRVRTRANGRPASDATGGRAVGEVTRPMSRRQVDGSGEVPFGRRRTRVLLSAVAVLVVVCVVGAFFVLPARAWLRQRDGIAEAEADKNVLWEEIRRLEQRYEWWTGQSNAPPPAFRPGAPPATAEAQLGLFEHLERELEAAGFFHPPEKTPGMIQNLRAALGRARFTDQEVRTFRGVVTALSRGRGKVLEKIARRKTEEGS